MTRKLPETLEAKVEQLVREHLAEEEVAVRAALARAFGGSTPPRVTGPRRTASRRRATSEVVGLAERLFDAVKACPGERMTVIAARVGERPRSLQQPMMHLKEAGRVRSAGQRNATRYFPMVAASSA